AARGTPPPEDTFIALADVFERHDLPVQPFRDLLAAFRMDVTRERYAGFEDLLGYCRYSANPVGRLMLALFDASDADNRVLSDRICTALQLLNFLQDIESDYRDRGRIYLPQEDLHAEGVEEEELAEGCRGNGVRAVVREQVERTRRLLDEGAPLIGRVPRRLGLQLAATVEAATLLLQRLEGAPEPVRLQGRDIPLLLGRTLRRFSRSRPPSDSPRK
ncbi:MAG TPA: squalene/phytoene synthase family protein, partial [Gammaproteobacteria bacterium]|nr:squalene/phytoene synthase family protein [Gammaproteobacteria bacterium]